jgi:hypothetical protein
MVKQFNQIVGSQARSKNLKFEQSKFLKESDYDFIKKIQYNSKLVNRYLLKPISKLRDNLQTNAETVDEVKDDLKAEIGSVDP